MKQIKTIYVRGAAAFDTEVNRFLQEGWKLTRRGFDDAGFIAEMEKDVYVETPEPHVCENCKHGGNPLQADPCRSCIIGENNKWEAKE